MSSAYFDITKRETLSEKDTRVPLDKLNDNVEDNNDCDYNSHSHDNSDVYEGYHDKDLLIPNKQDSWEDEINNRFDKYLLIEIEKYKKLVI